ncbi:MAG: hypothetical protein ACJ71T_16545 [Actinomycetales bacterium]
MPTHLLLEGEDIESVLARLRDDHGPDARIIQAELVRSGGFAGFFAKRRYEVTVEVDEDPLVAADDVVADPPYQPTFEPRATSAGYQSTPTNAIDALLTAAESADQTEIGGTLLVETDGAATSFVPTTPGWHRPVSTEGTAFSAVLRSLTQNLTEQQVHPAFEAVVPEPRTAPEAPFATHVEAPIAASVAAPVAAPREPVFERMVKDLSRCREQLAAIGVPAPLLAKIASSEPLLALRDLVEAAAEPRQPAWTPSATRGGALVVVVGSWAVAETTVRGLVRELEIDDAAVLAVAAVVGDALPPGQSVRSHAAAVELVRESRQAYGVSIVVVDPGHGRHSADRVAELVKRLEPQHVLVAAAADEDMQAGLAAVDALAAAQIDVDGLALDRVAGSAAPAAAFEIPLPVCWVDGRFATTGRWIGLLVDAMSRVGEHRC